MSESNGRQRPVPRPAEVLQDFADSAQGVILEGARFVQRSYRFIHHEGQDADAGKALLGAGVGSCVGLGLGILLRASPAGRLLTVLGGALSGAVLASHKSRARRTQQTCSPAERTNLSEESGPPSAESAS